MQTVQLGEFTRDSVSRSIAGSRPPISPANDKSATSPAFAKRSGYDVVGTFKETGSGVKLDRAERRKVMALAQARQVGAVLVTELSRSGHSTTVLLATPKELEARRV